MKKLLFLIPLVAFGATTQTPPNYMLLDAQGNILEVFVAAHEVAINYPACVKEVYPTAVSCVPVPIQPTVDATPVGITMNNTTLVVTTNNAVVTTNNAAQ
jgi:hypothetical protein